MKNNEVVQVLKGFKTQEKCKKHISLNKKLYFPIITLDMIENDICKDY